MVSPLLHAFPLITEPQLPSQHAAVPAARSGTTAGGGRAAFERSAKPRRMRPHPARRAAPAPPAASHDVFCCARWSKAP
eukprot:gene1508-5167_t